MMGGDSSKDLEPLNVKDRRVCRWVQDYFIVVCILKIKIVIIN
jgi:hypothetical protein